MRNASNRQLALFLLIVLSGVALSGGCASTTKMSFHSWVVPEEGGTYGAKLPVGKPSIWINHSRHIWSIPDSAEGFRRSEILSSSHHVSFVGIWEYYDAFIDELTRQLDSMGFTVVDSANAELEFRMRGSRSYGGRGYPFPRDMNNIDHGRYTGGADYSSLSIIASLPAGNELRQPPYRSRVWKVHMSGLSGAIVEQQFPVIVREMLSAYGKNVDTPLSLQCYAEPSRKSR